MVTVAVSGLGAVCGLGWGIPALWEGLRAGRAGFAPIQRFDPSRHRTRLAAEAGTPPVEFVRSFGRSIPGWRRLSIADRFALFAALEAAGQAGLEVPFADTEDLTAGVY